MKLSSIKSLLILLLLASMAHAAPSVRLITIGPGDQVWEKFGHNMLWVHDPEKKTDLCYNWGLFDFDQPGFLRNFVQGKMTYWMDAFTPPQALGPYFMQKRQVRVQQLHLSVEQANLLIAACAQNALPMNRAYKYDYFRDNCSTRVRDMINLATGGELKRQLDQTVSVNTLSYRQHALRLMQDDTLLSVGMDLVLGPACDKPLTAWEAAFLPTHLAASVEPMTSESWRPWQSPRPPEPQTVPNRAPMMLVIGLFTASAILILSVLRSKWFRRAGMTLIFAWWSVSTLASVFMICLWFFTDHVAAYANQNLLQFSPLAFALLVAWIAVRPKPTVVGKRVVGALAGSIMLLGLIGLIGNLSGLLIQQNLTFIALALPINIAAGLTVSGRMGLLKRL
jgi:hypothetical protein